MPGLRDIEQSVKLEDGQVFVGLYDPTKDVGVSESDFGTRYAFRMLNNEGRLVVLKGGTRMFDKIVGICGAVNKPRFLKITAKGKMATMERDYTIEEVSGFPPK